MQNGDFKDYAVRLLYGAVGIVCGFLCFWIRDYLPKGRSVFYIGCILALMVLISIFDKVRYHKRFAARIAAVTKDLKEAGDGTIPIEPEENCEEGVAGLYMAAERLRLKLKKKIRIQQAVLDLENTLAINIEMDDLIQVLLPRLVEETNSNWGVFYLYNRIIDRLELKHSIGLSKNVYREFDVEIGEGLIGTAAKMKKICIQKDIPRDTIFENRTFLGKILPKNIMTVPIYDKDELLAVLAFASIYEYNDEQLSVIELIRNYLGFSITNCVAYERTQRLTKELQFQNELIQNMNDELEKKVSDRTDFLNGIIDSIKDYVIISVDKDGYVTTWNEGAEQIRGYQAEEALGRHFGSVYDDQEERELIKRQLDIALKEGQFREIGWRQRRDGARFYLDTYITPIYNKNGELQGFTNISKDITLQELLEEDLLLERALSRLMVESSERALLFTDKEGVIRAASRLCSDMLGTKEGEVRGKYFFEFFIDGERLLKNMVASCNAAGKGEFAAELLYKHDGIQGLTIQAGAVVSATESGVLGMLMQIAPEKEREEAQGQEEECHEVR